MAERPHSHLIDFPEALEAFFARVGELEVVLGAQAAPGLARVEALIRDALAARDRGDAAAAAARIGEAMAAFAALAGEAMPGEAPVLRGAAERFRRALGAGAVGEAKETADAMRERSGSVLTPKKSG
ncbi:MAG TPA: hypothetical protein VKW76_07335 [Candidatus Binatia bacterium]|nr:hypothetical protein [Candidatus Binatia bacterium]